MLEFEKATASRGRSDLCRFLASVFLLSVLAGCGGQSMPFPPPESELGPRPGLFTGDTGAWNVFSGLPSKSQPDQTGTPK